MVPVPVAAVFTGGTSWRPIKTTFEGLLVVVEGRGDGPGVCTQAESVKAPADKPTTRRQNLRARDGERIAVPFFVKTG